MRFALSMFVVLFFARYVDAQSPAIVYPTQAQLFDSFQDWGGLVQWQNGGIDCCSGVVMRSVQNQQFFVQTCCQETHLSGNTVFSDTFAEVPPGLYDLWVFSIVSSDDTTSGCPNWESDSCYSASVHKVTSPLTIEIGGVVCGVSVPFITTDLQLGANPFVWTADSELGSADGVMDVALSFPGKQTLTGSAAMQAEGLTIVIPSDYEGLDGTATFTPSDTAGQCDPVSMPVSVVEDGGGGGDPPPPDCNVTLIPAPSAIFPGPLVLSWTSSGDAPSSTVTVTLSVGEDSDVQTAALSAGSVTLDVSDAWASQPFDILFQFSSPEVIPCTGTFFEGVVTTVGFTYDDQWLKDVYDAGQEIAGDSTVGEFDPDNDVGGLKASSEGLVGASNFESYVPTGDINPADWETTISIEMPAGVDDVEYTFDFLPDTATPTGQVLNTIRVLIRTLLAVLTTFLFVKGILTTFARY